MSGWATIMFGLGGIYAEKWFKESTAVEKLLSLRLDWKFFKFCLNKFHSV